MYRNLKDKILIKEAGSKTVLIVWLHSCKDQKYLKAVYSGRIQKKY